MKILGMIFLMIILAVSCVEQRPGGVVVPGGEGVDVALSFNVQAVGDGAAAGRSIDNPGVDTDECMGPNYIPHDVWMMQYGGTADDAPLVGRPKYVELSGVTNIQAAASTVPNTLLFVANTHDANREWGDISTLSRLKSYAREISRQDDLCGSNLYAEKDLILSGMYQGVITSSNISVELSRNIARLDFVLKNAAGSGMTLRSVQLCNVPRDCYYFSSLISGNGVFPSVINYFDYPAEGIAGAADAGGEQSFTFYVPVNERGVVTASTSSQLKSAYAPPYATYLRVEATDPLLKGYVYTIYPGANLINDYNLSANKRYRVELSVNSPGDASSDGRVDDYGLMELSGANSYILNPAPVGAADRVFTFPIGRLNEFWQSADGSLTIGDDDEWVAELIWQDAPQGDFVRFVDLPGGGLQTTLAGRGHQGRIAVTVKAGSEGNALVGIKKRSRQEVGYLWSWHLWVTDYDPTYVAPAVQGQYVYSVTDGAVHRYGSELWKAPGGIYQHKYMMDRDLGARSPKYGTVGALFYQFGRKDPFPFIGSGNVLYDINGVALGSDDTRNATTMNKSAGKGVTLATGVLNPTFFYGKSSADNLGDWSNQGLQGDHPWNDPQPVPDKKSLFDPCPAGWKLPHKRTWADFAYYANYPDRSTTLNADRDPKLAWNYQGTNGVRYWPLGERVVGSIYFPVVGCRHVSFGGMVNVDVSLYYWADASYSEIGGCCFYAADGRSVIAATYMNKAYGCQVRCVQQ